MRAHQDPNGTAWSKDKSKLGFKLLEKMGWKEGKGLGRNEDGVTEHIKVKVKQENVGVGSGFDVSSWKANTKRFEATLSRFKERTGKRETSEASVSSEGVTASVYIPPSPKGSPKTGPLISSRRSYNRKLIRSKQEFKKDAAAREIIVGKAENAEVEEKKKSKKKDKPEQLIEPPTEDNLTEMQTTAVVSMADYFSQKASKAGHVAVKKSEHITFASFNAGLDEPPSEKALKRKRAAEGGDDEPKAKKSKKEKKAKAEEVVEEAPKKKEKKGKKDKKDKKEKK